MTQIKHLVEDLKIWKLDTVLKNSAALAIEKVRLVRWADYTRGDQTDAGNVA